MKNKKKTATKQGKLRLIITLIVFLISMVVIIGLFILPFMFEVVRNALLYIILVYFVLVSALLLFIANSASQVDFKISWMTVVACIPIAGPLLYLIFAQKETKKSQIRKRAKREKIIEIDEENTTNVYEDLAKLNYKNFQIANSINLNVEYPTYKDSKFEYFKLGELGFPKVIEELKKAKRFIFLEFFIIERGVFFDSIYEILKEKVKDGVEVRLIYDDFGSAIKINPHFYKKAINDGIKVFRFNKIRPAADFRQNSRDHRKIIIIDGVVAFSGGCNIADEYINKINRFGVWKDNIFMLKGKAVDGYVNIFLQSWSKNENEFIDDYDERRYYFDSNRALADSEIEPDGFLCPYGEVPLDDEFTTRNTWLQIINSARKYVFISTPYLIPDSTVLTALENKAKEGVRVAIVTPGIPDKRMVYSVTRSYYSSLLMSGVEIYEYTPGFNHAKVIVSDDDVCSVGTANLDYRSFYLIYECSLLVMNSKEILKVRDDLVEMMSVSKLQDVNRYVNANFFTKLYWGILRIIAPFF